MSEIIFRCQNGWLHPSKKKFDIAVAKCQNLNSSNIKGDVVELVQVLLSIRAAGIRSKM